MKKTPYNLFEDPGHAWLAVPLKDLDELGIRHLISGYSYQKGNTAYLEEDCDMSVFFKAYEVKFGTKPPYVVKAYNYLGGPQNAPCKSYPHYQTVPNYDPEAYMTYLGYKEEQVA